MPHYVVLVNLGEEQKKRIKESTIRRAEEKALVEKAGVKIHGIYHTLGLYDTVWVVEAPTDEVAFTLLLTIGKMRGIKTTTLRAFTEEEVDTLFARVP